MLRMHGHASGSRWAEIDQATVEQVWEFVEDIEYGLDGCIDCVVAPSD